MQRMASNKTYTHKKKWGHGGFLAGDQIGNKTLTLFLDKTGPKNSF